MKTLRIWLPPFCLLLASLLPLPAFAEYGMLIPSRVTVENHRDAGIFFSLRYWRPFENTGKDLEMPNSFQVYHLGKITDLSITLMEGIERGKRTWTGSYTVGEPGSYAFVMEQRPVYAAERDAFVIHYTKAYVDAFGSDEGWDSALGLKAEIVPLVAPGSLYAGNVFQGLVLVDGRPAPNARLAVEWYPGPGLRGVAPDKGMITQTLRTGATGVFTYAAPRSGWWCFAATVPAKELMPYQGADKPVELRAVFWVYFHTMPAPVPLEQK